MHVVNYNVGYHSTTVGPAAIEVENVEENIVEVTENEAGFAVNNGTLAAMEDVMNGPIMREAITEVVCTHENCDLVFPTLAALNKHKGNDHHEGKVQCGICFLWMLPKSLQRHERNKHLFLIVL